MTRIFWLVLLAVAGLACGYAVTQTLAADKTKGGAPKVQAASVQVAIVQEKSMAPQLTGVGSVIAYQSVALAARLDSQINEIKFKPGDDVVKGAPLFILDARELRAQMAQAKAKLAGDQALAESLKKEYERQALGAEKGFASQSMSDTAKAAYENQKAAVALDQAAIQSLNVQLDYTIVTAPIDGRTGTINITVGNTVRANDTAPLVTINQIKPISVQSSLPQNSIDTVRAAMARGPVPVIAVTPTGRRVQGTLEYIDNTIDAASGTYVTRTTFMNEDEALWPGTLVNVVIDLGQNAPALIIPEVAVQHGQNGDFVYVITDNTAAKRMVKVGRLQDSLAIITDGLKAGEQVATDGMLSVKDGGPVTISADKNEPAADTRPPEDKEP